MNPDYMMMFGTHVLIKMENNRMLWSEDKGLTWKEIEEKRIVAPVAALGK